MREKITAEQYTQMKETDIRSVDPATVPDIRDIYVNPALPPADPGGRPTDEGQSLRLPLRRSFGQDLLCRNPAPPGCPGGVPGTF